MSSSQGPLCAVCDEGSYRALGTCFSCSESTTASWIVFVLITVVGVCLTCVHFAPGERTEQLTLLLGGLRILVTSYQIIETFNWSLGVIFPDTVGVFFNAFSFISLNFGELFPSLQCAVDNFNYYTDLIALVVCLSVIVLVLGIVIGW